MLIVDQNKTMALRLDSANKNVYVDNNEVHTGQKWALKRGSLVTRGVEIM
jgi:hypothetical protein